MRAVVLAMEHFLKQVQGKIVLIHSDNSTVSTVVTYINRWGATKSPSLYDDMESALRVPIDNLMAAPLTAEFQAVAAMRAICVSEFGGPEVLKVAENVPKPELSKTQILARVHACGVNPIDTYICRGIHAIKPKFPYIPGFDGAGIVEDVGESVTQFKAGDRVYFIKTPSGSYAEYAVAEEEVVGKLDDKVSFEQGAAIGIPYGTAYKALVIIAHIHSGQTVLIHGASGGTGLAACQIAHAYGLKVLGTAGTSEGQEAVLQNGADAVFNHAEAGYMEKILDATGGVGPDLILEMLASVNINSDLEIIKKLGMIVVIGTGGPDKPMTVDQELCKNREVQIKNIAVLLSTQNEFTEMHTALEEGMRLGWLCPKVAQIFPLDDASQAHEQVKKRSGKTGKIILKI